MNYLITSGALILLLATDAAAAGGGHVSILHESFKLFNFGLFLFLLYLFLFKRLKGFFRQRSQGIRDEIENADTAKNDAEKKLGDISEKLDSVEKEIANLRTKAREDGEKIRDRIIKEAEEIAERIIEQTKRNIQLETKRAKAQLQKEAALLAIEMAEELLKKNIKQEDHSRLIDEYIEKLEKID